MDGEGEPGCRSFSIKGVWVLSLCDNTVCDGGDMTHLHSYTSANRSALCDWLPAYTDVLSGSRSGRMQTPFGAMSLILGLLYEVVQVVKEV